MADNLTPKEEFLLNPVTEHNITDAAIASFETNLKHPVKVTVPITPQQDLHGYDAPWPAGGGKNKLDPSKRTTYGSGYGQRWYATDGFTLIANQAYTFSVTYENPIALYIVDKSTGNSLLNGNNTVTYTPSEDIVVYFQAYREQDISSINTFQLELGSSATSYAPYSNECPISGWTGAEVWNDPKYGWNIWWNQIASQDYDNYRKINCGISTSGNVKTISLNSGKTDCIYTFKKNNVILPANHISLFVVNNLDLSHINGRVRASYVNAVNNSTDHPLTNNNYRIHSMSSDVYGFGFYASELSEGDYYTFTSINVFDLTAMFGSAVAAQIYAMEQAHTGDGIAWFKNLFPKDYYAYNSGTETVVSAVNGDPYKHIPINWQTEAGTIYGGTVTLNEDGSADVVSEYVSASITGNVLNSAWESQDADRTSLGCYRSSDTWSRSGLPFPAASGILFDYCQTDTCYFNDNWWNANMLWISGVFLRFEIRIPKEVLATPNLAGAQAYLNAHPLQAVYKIAPLTYHFPNVGQLKAFLGQNNVWSDAGNVNVKYLTQNSATGLEYRGDRALELRRRAMIGDAPTIHTTIGSEETGGLASFKSYIKAPVKKIEIPFGPKQDLHGYDNPWPAGGGKNLWSPSRTLGVVDPSSASSKTARVFDISKFYNAFSHTGVYYSGDVGDATYIDGVLTIPNSTAIMGVGFPFKLNSGNTYTLSWELVQGGITAYAASYDSSGVWTAWSYASQGTPSTSKAFTVPDGTETTLIVIRAISNNTVVKNIQLELGSTATAYEPYENICPIEGHDGCEIKHCGQNLFDNVAHHTPFTTYIGSKENLIVAIKQGQMLIRGFYVSSSEGIISYTSSNQYWVIFPLVLGKSYTTYRFGKTCYILNSDFGVVRSLPLVNDTDLPGSQGGNYVSFTAADNEKYLALYVYNIAQSLSVQNWTLDDVINEFMIVNGLEHPESYTPYQGSTIPLTFNQSGDHSFTPIQEGTGDPSPENVRPMYPGLTITRDDDSVLSVYGGTLTVNADGTGSLAKTHDIDTYDGSIDENWLTGTLKNDVYGSCVRNNNVGRVWGDDVVAWSNMATQGTGAYTQSLPNKFYTAGNWLYFSVDATAASTVEDLRTFLFTNNLQVVYPLAEPVTYTLSITETNRALEALGLTQHIGPIYGGTITINPDGSADVVSNHGVVDLGMLSWYALSYKRFTSAVLQNMKQYGTTDIAPIISSELKSAPKSAIEGADNQVAIAEGSIWVCKKTATDAANCKELLTGVQLVYELITPQTYHFSNLEQLKVWLGENNFWCDISDDITVKYWNRG